MSPFPVISSLLLCLVFPITTFSFSFVTIQHQHQHQHQHQLRHRHRHRQGSSTSSTATSAVVLVGDNTNDSDDDYVNTDNMNCDDISSSSPAIQSRRRMLSSIIAGVITSGVVTPQLKHAFAVSPANAATTTTATATTNIGTPEQPIAIVGGGGRTGMALAESIADPKFGNMHAVTLSRSGKDPFRVIKLPQSTKENLQHRSEPFDVRDSQESISASLKALSPSVVVFAASASRQGGNVFEVDDVGVEKVATACNEIGAMFVLISALAVDRPDSKSYQITNTLGGNYQGIMDAKYNGEEKTKRISNNYVIVRPGVLLNGKTTTGPVGLELNQGDTIGGGLSRDELAGIVVGAIQSRGSSTKKKKAGTGGITVEAYRKSTAQKLEKKYAMPSGNELTIDAAAATTASYRELFANAKTD